MWKRHVEFRVVMIKPNPQTLLGEFEHMKDKKRNIFKANWDNKSVFVTGKAWVQVLTVPLAGCVLLTRSPHCLEPQRMFVIGCWD